MSGATTVTDWLSRVAESDARVFAKRLSANDTLASGGHQAGPYLPRDFVFEVFPEVRQRKALNPDVFFPLHIVSHGDERTVRAVWYNNLYHGRTRNETRLTRFGGTSSALLEPDNTAAVAVFVFMRRDRRPSCEVWVCRSRVEEAEVEAYVGPVLPGSGVVWTPATGAVSDAQPSRAMARCRPSRDEIPASWLQHFPTGLEIARRAINLLPCAGSSADARLLTRSDCEYHLFRAIERESLLPVIQKGFPTVDDFLARASSILNRRKARAGRSLELHVREILSEERLIEGSHFEHNVESEPGRRPDFLFPNQAAYRDEAFPGERLRMLAVKRSCKDRWRQILNEAGRIETKHLLTLEEGVSENQHREMTESGVQLVVPQPLHRKYPRTIRGKLMSLDDFVVETQNARIA